MKKSNYVFGSVPMIRASRSKFDLSFTHKTSGNVGKLYPFFCQEVYPGDTFKTKSTILARLNSAYLRPVMDNLFLDQYFFFVPSRLVFDKFAQVFGENKQSPWAVQNPPSIPCFANTQSTGNIALHDNVCAYLYLPVGEDLKDNIKDISLLPARAFALIYDEWFRDENNVQPMNIHKGDASASEVLNNEAWSQNNYLGKCPSVAKFHDYFTSCLPSPQKGDAVEVGTIAIPERVLPVAGLPYAGNTDTSSRNYILPSVSLFPNDGKLTSLMEAAGYGTSQYPTADTWRTTHGAGKLDVITGGRDYTSTPKNTSGPIGGLSATSTDAGILYADPNSSVQILGGSAQFANLGAYDPGLVLGATSVNDLRLAFQTQKMLEKDARGGTRYREYILSHFGVSVADSRVQVPEFLGGKRSPLNVQQVAQTSQATTDSPLASLGAYSLSFGQSGFSKGFTEHGYIIGVMCLRHHHTYQQGVERFAFRKNRLDFYDPVFANIGEQPVYKKELFAGAAADDVFGYQEAWADLRYRPSRVSGQLASKSTNTLDIYHFGDEYSNAPTLSEGFINETDSNFARTIAIANAENADADQFVFDIYCQNEAIRELPVYSVPSLIDHH